MKINLIYYGNPLLRQRSLPIEEITPEIREFAHAMVKFARVHSGLAAVQAGKLIRLFVMRLIERWDEEKGEVHYGPSIVCINPRIVKRSDTMEEASESCVSIPGVPVTIERPDYVMLEAQDLEGKIFRLEAYGYNARIILHENDHLNGILCTDYLSKEELEEIKPKLKRLKKKYA